jgi:ParB-like nuclease domain
MNRAHCPSIQQLAISQITPDPLNARTHSARQIGQIANSILAFGFTNPLLVTEDYELIAGEGRWRAANQLGIATVPVIIIAGLSPAKRRALSIADNKIAGNASWDCERLAIILPELASSLPADGLDVSILGFEPYEIDQLQTDFEKRTAEPCDRLDPTWLPPVVVTEPGDLWLLIGP